MKIWSYRLAAVWCILFSINSLCSCIMAAFMGGTDWSALRPQWKVLLIVSIANNWTTVIMAFLSKNSKKIESGEIPDTNGNGTTVIKKLQAGEEPKP